MKKHFDVKNWIKRYYNLYSDDKVIDSTNNSLEFIWVWSIFEHHYLKDSRNHKSFNDQLVDVATNFPTDNFKIDINSPYGFFHNRYFNKGKTTKFFGNLNFDNKWQKRTKEILKNTNPTENEKLELILLIVYKFRCNLFHGRKDPLLWKNFEIVFFYINKFLSEFLDTKWKYNI